jgi:hypothetical protein
MGETRDNVVEKAQDLAGNAASQAQDAAGTTIADAETKRQEWRGAQR